MILTKKEIEAEGITAIVDNNRCSGCGLCVMVCPYNALEMNEEEKATEENASTSEGNCTPSDNSSPEEGVDGIID